MSVVLLCSYCQSNARREPYISMNEEEIPSNGLNRCHSAAIGWTLRGSDPTRRTRKFRSCAFAKFILIQRVA